MPQTSIPIEGLLEGLRDWINSIQHDKQDRAKVDSERIAVFARMLAENPKFQTIYAKNLDDCPATEPRAAINCMCAFLNAVTEASRPT